MISKQFYYTFLLEFSIFLLYYNTARLFTMKDFFLNFNSSDIEWAEWTASILENAGYTVFTHSWDSGLESNFLKDLEHHASQAKGVIILLSPDYLDMPCSVNDWFVALETISEKKERNLLSIKIGNCSFYSLLLETTYFIDLVGLKRREAENLLIQAIELCISMVPQQQEKNEEKRFRFIKGLPRYFNVPYLKNQNFWGRESILVKIRSTLTSDNEQKSKIVIHGIGGVGKTHIAVEYAYRYADNYDIIWWVRTENSITMTADLVGLSERLNLTEKNNKDQEASIHALLNFLKKEDRWLIIFDNADNPEILLNYIPKDKYGHVIITSRNPSWENIYTLKVPVMNRRESIELLQNLTQQKNQKIADELANNLGDLPLALVQVGSFIKDKQTSLPDYLSLFKKSQRNIHDISLANSEYPQSVFTSFNISFQQLEKKSPEAMNLMYLLSFMAPDFIPLDILFAWTKKYAEKYANTISDINDLNKLVEKLAGLSLVSSSDKFISVHRLIQNITLNRMETIKRKNFGVDIINFLNESFIFEKDNNESWTSCSILLPHVISTIEHSEAYEIKSDLSGILLTRAGDYLVNFSEYSDAEKLLDKALGINRNIYGKNHPEVAKVHFAKSKILYENGNFPEAQKEINISLKMDKDAYGYSHPDVSRDLNFLGIILCDLGEFEEARKNYDLLLKIDINLYHENHPMIARDYNNLGMVLNFLKEHEKARECFEKALAIYKKANDKTQIALTLSNLGLLLINQKDFVKARKCIQSAIDMNEENYPGAHPIIAIEKINLGLIEKELGHKDKALALFNQALLVFKKVYGMNHPHIVTTFLYVGDVWFETGNSLIAKEYFKNALKISEKIYGKEHVVSDMLNERLEKVSTEN